MYFLRYFFNLIYTFWVCPQSLQSSSAPHGYFLDPPRLIRLNILFPSRQSWQNILQTGTFPSRKSGFWSMKGDPQLWDWCWIPLENRASQVPCPTPSLEVDQLWDQNFRWFLGPSDQNELYHTPITTQNMMFVRKKVFFVGQFLLAIKLLLLHLFHP